MDGKTIALNYRQLGGLREGGPVRNGIIMDLWGKVDPPEAQAYWDNEIMQSSDEVRLEVFRELLVLLPDHLVSE